MKCLRCGRKLKSQESKDLNYGPSCYRILFGISKKSRSSQRTESTDSFPYYDIQGQMTLDDYIQ